MRVAASGRLAVVPRGAGTKMEWGNRPQQLDVLLDTTGLDELVEHAAGDLILVTGSGRRLDMIQQDVAGSGQLLGIDPARTGTVGGAVATASSGPMRLRHGAVRDLVIGMTFVRADGVIAHSGGKVVKNVAGYDLAKLLTGSHGTLGVITEVALRLHPVSQARQWVTVDVIGAGQAHDVVQAVVHSQLMASAIELDFSGGRGQVAVMLEAHLDAVEATTQQAVRLLPVRAQASDRPPQWWGREHTGVGVELKVTHDIGSLCRLLDAVTRAETESGTTLVLRGSPGVGIAIVGVTGMPEEPSTDALVAVVTSLRSQANSFGGTVVVLEAPDGLRDRVNVWGPVSGVSLMRSVKEQFDPGRLLAPGRFVGGI